MRIIARKTLRDFWESHPDSEAGLRHWYEVIETNDWQMPGDVATTFKGADIINGERVVFNIARNKYRLVVAFDYAFQTCWIKFVGTHAEYDRIDAKTVDI